MAHLQLFSLFRNKETTPAWEDGLTTSKIPDSTLKDSSQKCQAYVILVQISLTKESKMGHLMFMEQRNTILLLGGEVNN